MQLTGTQPRHLEQTMDALMKRFPSYKCIISRILHYGVKEFLNYTPDYIEHNCFPDSDGELALKLSNEDIGSIQDLVFNVQVSGEDIPRKLVIDMEPQTTDELKYALATRAIFYSSSVLSRQYETIFSKSEYNKIQKVYSIWIVTHPVKNKGTLTTYKIEQNNVVGVTTDTERDYDILSVIIASLRDVDSNNSLLKFFNETFGFKESKEQCLQRL